MKKLNNKGIAHILLFVVVLAVFTVIGFSYLQIKNRLKNKTGNTNQSAAIENNLSTNAQQGNVMGSDINTNAQQGTVSLMVLDENTFAGWGLKFVGDKTKANNITFISPVDVSGKDVFTYGFFDNETSGKDGSIVVKTRKKESKPDQIIAVTNDLIEYGKKLKTSETKVTFNDCIRSPYGGWIAFWTKQQVDDELKLDPQQEGPKYYIAQKLKESGKLIGSVYPYYQQPTGTCVGAVDNELAAIEAAVQDRVQENIKSTAQYIIDNLQPL
jgi:hypothetical protein